MGTEYNYVTHNDGDAFTSVLFQANWTELEAALNDLSDTSLSLYPLDWMHLASLIPIDISSHPIIPIVEEDDYSTTHNYTGPGHPYYISANTAYPSGWSKIGIIGGGTQNAEVDVDWDLRSNSIDSLWISFNLFLEKLTSTPGTNPFYGAVFSLQWKDDLGTWHILPHTVKMMSMTENSAFINIDICLNTLLIRDDVSLGRTVKAIAAFIAPCDQGQLLNGDLITAECSVYNLDVIPLHGRDP